MQRIDSALSDDTRGVSEVIGLTIIFGFLVILLSVNQAQIVPQQTGEIEYQHFQQNQDDLIEVRNAILTAGRSDVSQYPSVKLGTDFPPRVFAVNPPPASGTLRTHEYNVSFQNTTTSTNVTTQFIEYKPRYNQLEADSTWYENSVLYLDTQGQDPVVIEEQEITRDKNTTALVLLQNEFEQSGVGKVTLEIYHIRASAAQEIPTGNITIEIPTRLPESYWEDEFNQTAPNKFQSFETDGRGEGINELTISVNRSEQSEELILNTVGIGSEPDEGGPKQNIGPSGTGGSDRSDESGSSTPRGFSSVSASDLSKNSAPSTQRVGFTVNETLPDGESVTINLDDPQSGSIDYQTSNISSVNGSLNRGNTQFTNSTNTAEISYTATEDIPAGDTIELDITSVDYPNGNLGEFTVRFTRSDGTSETDIFSEN